MANKLITAIELRLKDGFSANIKKCAGAASGFSKETLGAINKVDEALSGTAAKLAAFGVTLSVGSAAKEIIEFDHELTRIGLTANATAKEISNIKQKIYDAAQKYKVSTTIITEAAGVLSTNTGDLVFLEDTIDHIAKAIQAAGTSGADMGAIISQFNLIGKSAEDVSYLMDKFVRYGDTGSYTFVEFSRTAEKVMSAYGGQIGTTNDDLLNMYRSMLILKAGIGSADESASALEATLNELSNKQEDLRKVGIEVVSIDGDTGEKKLRDLHVIMKDIRAVSEKKGNTFWLNGILGEQSLRAMRAFMMYADDFDKKIDNLGDTSGALEEKAGVMAKTMQSNVQNLQTAFNRFADSSLTKPLSAVTDLLNHLAQDPENIERLFEAVAKGLIAITAIKGIAGVSRFISSINGLKSGAVNITESLSMASAMPVYVTNWGGGVPMGTGRPGGAGPGSFPNTPNTRVSAGLLDQYGNPIPVTNRTPPQGVTVPAKNNSGKIPKGMKTLGAVAITSEAAFEGYQLYQDLQSITNSELTEKEKAIARSEAVGGTTGKVAGSAVGMIVGGLVGSLAGPGGTVIGASIGSSIFGFLGEKGGEWLGTWRAENEEKQKNNTKGHYKYTGVNGIPMWVEPQVPAANLPPQITQTKTEIPPQKVALEGQAVMDVNINVSDERPAVQATVRNNSIHHMRFNTGDTADVWMIP